MESINPKILDKVLNKKELRGIDREIAIHILKDNFPTQEYEAAKVKDFNLRSSQTKECVKAMRRVLRDVHGVFYDAPLSKKDKQQYIEGEKSIKSLLKKHISTKERYHDYPYLYKQFQEYFGGYTSVADIGCGLNPLSFINSKVNSVYCTDISNDVLFVGEILNKEGVEVKAEKHNIINVNNREQVLENCQGRDIVFCLKIFDSLESLEKDTTRKTLSALMTSMISGIIVSFSLRTVSGKNFIEGNRYWFKNVLNDLDIEYKIIASKTEKYYLIRT